MVTFTDTSYQISRGSKRRETSTVQTPPGKIFYFYPSPSPSNKHTLPTIEIVSRDILNKNFSLSQNSFRSFQTRSRTVRTVR